MICSRVVFEQSWYRSSTDIRHPVGVRVSVCNVPNDTTLLSAMNIPMMRIAVLSLFMFRVESRLPFDRRGEGASPMQRTPMVDESISYVRFYYMARYVKTRMGSLSLAGVSRCMEIAVVEGTHDLVHIVHAYRQAFPLVCCPLKDLVSHS